ncbi:unnamed protein product [Polarella glacialis]|uniref:Uncharacterized protein n=1 Tax=Polarella glacialis TaxID=89957 RepID=A0A813LST9_POLGL|nr:unnamed protein product [Polarella glacialis]
MQPGAGRSRICPGVPGKAAAWKDERQSLMIEVHKVRQLPHNEPMSPKYPKPQKVWGSRKTRSTMSPGSIQVRFEKKLSEMFGMERIRQPSDSESSNVSKESKASKERRTVG